jgi:hypothetical protein
MGWTLSNPGKYAVSVLDPPPNHQLQRTGGQWCFAAFRLCQWSVVILPPPLSGAVRLPEAFCSVP